MKAIKYLFMSALLMGFSTGALAQDGTAADVAAVKNLIKSNPADLAKQMKAYYSKNKKNTDNLVEFGKAFFEAGDTANARVAANMALAATKQRSCAPAYLLLGDIAAQGEDGGGAAQNYEMAIHFDPKNAEAYRKYATVYRKVSLSGALSKLEELRRECPDYPVDALVAHLNYLSLKYSSAADSYSKVPVSQLTRRDFVEYAYSLYKNKKYADALNIIKSGLNVDAKNATLNRLGLYCATELKDRADADRFADVLFNKIDKDSVNITDKDWLHFGRAYLEDSLFNEAIEKYRAGLALNTPNSTDRPDLYKGISDAYKGLKNYPEAIKVYGDFLSAQEKADATDYAGLGTLHMLHARTLDEDAKMEAYRQADKVFAQLIEEYPEAQEYGYFQRARANNSLDPTMEQALAKPYFEKVIELISARDAAKLDAIDKSRLENSYRYLLGYYNSIMKDKEQALFYAEKVQELAPSENINTLVESLRKSVGQ